MTVAAYGPVTMAARDPHGVKVMLAPYDVVLAADTVVEPDLLVAWRTATRLQGSAPWLIDPDTPSITVLERHDGASVEVAHVEGTRAVEVTLPFPVRLVPAELPGG